MLDDVGLGYLRLGQSATTLSGRRSAARQTRSTPGRRAVQGTLFIFDEPTTGLHFDDIAKLLSAFQRLIEQRRKLLIIEHNLDVIKAADWVIDLGPEGGDRGGISWPRAGPRISPRSQNRIPEDFCATLSALLLHLAATVRREPVTIARHQVVRRFPDRTKNRKEERQQETRGDAGIGCGNE